MTCEIWQAVGIWIAGVGLILVLRMIISQNKKISAQAIKLQKEMADRDFKASERAYNATLFDKRFEVYEYFIRYFNNFDPIYSQHEINLEDVAAQFNLAVSVFNTYPYACIIPPNNLAKDNSSDTHQVCQWRVLYEIKDKLALSEFCYPKEISNLILEYDKYCFEILLNYRVLIKLTKDMDEWERAKHEKLNQNLTNLRKCHKQIKENDIVGKMKRLLNL
jgi:hypothetical protein